ncbi:aquaporin-9b isoform X2 [Mobula birostris]|uniref:aquaporin-9b isoform X2 n=1 Tax=Mobula birostris TaxID=1983395 RepID=UPI003B28B723
MESPIRKKSLVEHCRLKASWIKEGLAEFLGTFILILFGCGCIAQSVLSRGVSGNMLTSSIGFPFGVTIAVYATMGVSDAFMTFNGGNLTITGQNATAQIFSSYPAPHLSFVNGFADQLIGTAALLFSILAILDSKNDRVPKGLEPIVIGLILLVLGLSMGFNCGGSINPARDLGPRLFTAVAGWGFEVFRAGDGWWWVPVVAPLIGGVLGSSIYVLFIELHHQETVLEEVCCTKDKTTDENAKYEMISVLRNK